jgi:integrase
LAYLLAAHTGLRRSELEALEWGDVVLDVPQPHLRVRAATTKNHKAATPPLHGDLIGRLRELRSQSGGAADKVLERCPPMAQLKADLKKAGIPFQDEQGRQADFHALRHTFGTRLSVAGVPPRTAMELMRHSDLRLTMKVYTDGSLLPTDSAILKLPGFNSSQSE